MLKIKRSSPRRLRGKEGEGDVKGERKENIKRQSDKKTTKQVRIDMGWHKLVKIRAAKDGKTIKELVETCLIDCLSLKNYEK